MSRSGSKKPQTAPPELLDWQLEVIDRLASSKLAGHVTFGGGAALAAIYLHHRTSADVDFFAFHEVGAGELRPLATALSRSGTSVKQTTAGPRRSLVLERGGVPFGRVDFAYYPYDPIGRATKWRGLRVDSLVDITVNKIQAVLTRFQARDFVDLFFLLQEGPERDLDRLLDLNRAKFDMGADRFELGKRFLLVHDIIEIPRMLRPLSIEDLKIFFDARARELAGKG